MNWKTVLSKTLLGLAILGATIVYMACDVPLDGMIDIRESILSLIGLLAGFVVLARTWGRVLWRLVLVLAKDVRMFLDMVSEMLVNLFSKVFGKRLKSAKKRFRNRGKSEE